MNVRTTAFAAGRKSEAHREQPAGILRSAMNPELAHDEEVSPHAQIAYRSLCDVRRAPA